MVDKTMDQIADKIQKLLDLAGNNPSEQEAIVYFPIRK